MANWAGGTDPQTLANLKFKVAEGADLTEASTSIRIESSETALDITFMAKTLMMKNQ